MAIERPTVKPQQEQSFGTERTFWTRAGRRMRASPRGIIGLIIVGIISLMAILGPVLMPHDALEHNRDNRLVPPAFISGGQVQHFLGTDQLGRDLFSRIIGGARISFMVGLSTVVVAGLIGIGIGLSSGYFGGRVDTVLMRMVDAFMAIPGTILTLALIGVLGPSVFTVVIVLGGTGWVGYARVVRGEVMSIKARPFVESAVAVGQNPGRIIWRHILPNVSASIIVLATLQVATAIIAESGLSFLGLGVQAPAITWGSILSDGRDYVATAWWLALFPGVMITVTVLGIIFLGDWLRDVLDPKQR